MTPSRTTQIYTGNIIIFNNNDEGWGSAPGACGSRGHVGQEGLEMKQKNNASPSCTFLNIHCRGEGFQLKMRSSNESAVAVAVALALAVTIAVAVAVVVVVVVIVIVVVAVTVAIALVIVVAITNRHERVPTGSF